MKLQTKFLIAFVPMAVLTGSFITLLTRNAVRSIILEEVEKRGLSIVSDLADDMAQGFISRSESMLLPNLQLSQEKSGALYVMALDTSGKIIAHTNVMEKGKTFDDPRTREAMGAGPLSRPLSVDGKPALDISLPIWKPDDSFLFSEGKDKIRLGTVRMGIPLNEAEATQQKITRQILWIVALIGGLALGLALLLMRSILLPVQNLAKGTERIRGGQYGTTVPVLSKDELGDLAESFNRMSRMLSETIDQLKEAQAKVVRSEKLAAIGQLASGVGHELRNPLGAIRNVIYYMKDTLKDSPVAQQDPTIGEMLDLGEREIRSATNIISDLLDFSRVVRLAVQPTDVHTLLKETMSALDVPSNIKVSEDFGQNLPPAVMDPQRMRQVFTNLVLNAFQAMPRGGELKVDARMTVNGAPAGEWIAVGFQDSGVGIPPENLKKIFEPLFSTKAKGTGLGLAICQGIVEAHGGKILVASEPGKGSTFTIQFPLGGPQA